MNLNNKLRDNVGGEWARRRYFNETIFGYGSLLGVSEEVGELYATIILKKFKVLKG